MKRLLALCAAVLFVFALAPTAFGAAGGKDRDTFVQLLAFNDFHGNLQPPTGSGGRIAAAPGQTVDAGGVEYLSTWLMQLRTSTSATSITVGAGDLIGASPLISGLFHDEPTVEAMNALGLDVSSVGNHEFDEGVAELLRMQFGNSSAATAVIRTMAARTARRSAARSSSTSPRTSSTRARTTRSCRPTRSARSATRRSRSSASRSKVPR
jgi:hypothetical protein